MKVSNVHGFGRGSCWYWEEAGYGRFRLGQMDYQWEWCFVRLAWFGVLSKQFGGYYGFGRSWTRGELGFR